MRVVIQRVAEAKVEVEKNVLGKIDKGLLVFVGIEEADNDEDIEWLSRKIVNLRIFSDNDNSMNLSVKDIGGDILLISQFTLHASTKKGNRPSFVKAAKPEMAKELYLKFIDQLSHNLGKVVQKGEFGADMQVSLLNDGPVTITIDTKNKE